ncbi:MAG: sensor histidine kinase [Phycisphaerales bacterium]
MTPPPLPFPAPRGAHRRAAGWLPVRVRFTLWGAAVFLVLHATTTLVIMLFARQGAIDDARSHLRAMAESAAGPTDEAVRPPIPAFLSALHEDGRWARGVLVAVQSIDGNVSIQRRPEPPDADPEADPDWRAWVATLPDPLTHATVTGADGRRMLIASADLPSGERGIAGVHRDIIGTPIRSLRDALVLALLIGAAATVFAIWVVSGVALRSLDELRAFAHELTAENIDRPLKFEDHSPEIEALRAELEGAMRRLSEGYQRQARFLANVSHELKTPVSVIRTEAEVLLASKDPGTQRLRAFARSAGEEMHRLGNMIESFLTLTRVQSTDEGIPRHNLSANDILMEAVHATRIMARQHAVRITITLAGPVHPDESHDEPHAAHDDDAPRESRDQPTVTGNADLLQTAIANLIRNAIRFSPKDKPIQAVCHADEHAVYFTIRDHGPGIPPEVLDRLFEPFTQGDQERRRGRGTGLGLQIAQGIAEIHDGTITPENLESGCRFTLTLPRSSRTGQTDRSPDPALTESGDHG